MASASPRSQYTSGSARFSGASEQATGRRPRRRRPPHALRRRPTPRRWARPPCPARPHRHAHRPGGTRTPTPRPSVHTGRQPRVGRGTGGRLRRRAGGAHAGWTQARMARPRQGARAGTAVPPTRRRPVPGGHGLHRDDRAASLDGEGVGEHHHARKEEHGDDPVADDELWTFFDRLPDVTRAQGLPWRRQIARACDDLAGDLKQGHWPEPRCRSRIPAIGRAECAYTFVITLTDAEPERRRPLSVGWVVIDRHRLRGPREDHTACALWDEPPASERRCVRP